MAARCAAMAGAAVAARCAAVAGPAVIALLRRPRLHYRIRLSPLPSRTLRSHPPARCFQVSAAKKAKEAGDKTNQALSAEQQERIRKNKEAARQLLAERNVPPGFGDSWRRQLAGEFSKPCFGELMAFVAEERKRYTVYLPPEQVFTWTQMCDIWDVPGFQCQGL